MIEKLWEMLKKPITYPDTILQCPICQHKTNVGSTGTTIKWRLDCLNCCKTPSVPLVLTDYSRQGGFSDSNFEPITTKMHCKLPNDENNMFIWKFDYTNKTTTLSRIEKDCKQPVVHVFEEIMDINLENFARKIRMCLIFS